MFADADHEIIDSPEALFRHLYEEHGVAEALELDPETAPVQFWLRRHAELERAQRAARRSDPPPDPAPGGASAPDPEPARSRPDPGPRAEPRRQPEDRPAARDQRPPAAPRPEPPAGREGRRPARFGDPLLEAMTRALVGRGHDEAAVRSAIRSFPAGGGHPAGEPGVRAAFVEPMLQAVTEHLLGPTGPRRPHPAPAAAPAPASPRPAPAAAPPAASPRPAAAAPTPPPAAPWPGTAGPGPSPPPEEPARPEAAWAVFWSDLADTGRGAGEGGGPDREDGDDLMAVANAVQARRRVRLLRR
jgi:hypothetical protein